jgi:hypothetical protein
LVFNPRSNHVAITARDLSSQALTQLQPTAAAATKKLLSFFYQERNSTQIKERSSWVALSNSQESKRVLL